MVQRDDVEDTTWRDEDIDQGGHLESLHAQPFGNDNASTRTVEAERVEEHDITRRDDK